MRFFRRPSQTLQRPADDRKRCRKTFLTAFLVIAALFVLPLLTPRPALALKIALEESADHPKGIEIPPDDQLNPAEPVPPKPAAGGGQQTASPSSSAPAPVPSAPSSSASGQPARPPVKYHDAFALWEPMDRWFPLKTGNMTADLTNILNDKAWSVYYSHYSAIGNYYFEGGRSIGILKDFTGKFQYGRQVKETITSNSMQEFSAKIYGVETKYSKRSNRTSQSSGVNVTDNRTLSMRYQINKQFTLSYQKDRNVTRAITSSPSRSLNGKDAWALQWAGKNNWKFTLTNSSTLNRNYTQFSVNKVTQTDAILSFPVSKRLSAEAAYQIIGNRNTQSTGSSDTRKSLGSITAMYNLGGSNTVSYRFSTANDRSNNSQASTSFGTTSRDLKFQYAVLSFLNVTLQNTVSFNQASGKNAVRQGGFTIDHKKRKLLPGSTNVQLRRNINRSGATASPNTSDNYTMSISTPLSYFEGKFTFNYGYNLSQQRNLAPTGEQQTFSVSNTYNASLKLTPSFSLTGSTNNSKSNSLALPALSSMSENTTFTEGASLNIKRPFGKKLRYVPAFSYNLTNTRNLSETVFPSFNRTETLISKHTGTFSLKRKKWDGNYALEKSMNKPKGGTVSRANTNRLNLNFNELFGFKLTSSYSLAKQNNGSVSSGMFKATRPVRTKTNLSLSYQFSKNQAYENRQSNTINRIFDLILEMQL